MTSFLFQKQHKLRVGQKNYMEKHFSTSFITQTFSNLKLFKNIFLGFSEFRSAQMYI